MAKLTSYGEFIEALAGSRLVPGGFEIVIAPGVLVVELLISFALCSSRYRLAALKASMALGGLFVGYHLWTYRLGIGSSCNCLGWLLKIKPEQGVVLAIGIIVASAVAIEGTRAHFTTEQS